MPSADRIRRPTSVRSSRRIRRGRRPALEALEDRCLLSGSPFSVGGDPVVDPAAFRVTTFASGLNYPHGMQALADGSILVAVSNPNSGSQSYYNSTGELLRFVDANDDGVADGSPGVLFNGFPGSLTEVRQAGRFIIVSSNQAGQEGLSVLRVGATPADALTLAGSINFAFPSPWEHTTYGLGVRPTPGRSGSYDVFFNIGSQFNGIKRDAQGNILFDANGHAIPDPTTGTVAASGLVTGTLQGDSVYKVTLRDNGGTPVFSNLTQIATGLRNAASLAIDPATGDLLLDDNGIDGTSGGNEAWSADTLQRVPAADMGVKVDDFGFPYHYTLTNVTPGGAGTRIDLRPPDGVILPLAAFEPLVDPNLPTTGSESEGASGFALAPAGFPPGLDGGAFIGFHGVFNQAGTANEENPLLYADPATGKYFDFVNNDWPNIGHLDEAFSTTDSLFLADISSSGSMFSAPGAGVIYQVAYRPALPPLGDAGSEAPSAGPPGVYGSFIYDPTGSAWTYTGGAGVAADGSGFTSGNPDAPEGAQVAFLQGGAGSTISQQVAGWTDGTYFLTLDAAQRANYQSHYQDFQVLLDGQVVATIRPAGTAYAPYTTSAFAIAAGAHTITFRGLDTAGGDNTAFIDAVTLQRVPRVYDSGFEAPTAGPPGAHGSFFYGPTGSPWTYTGGAGGAADGSGFTSGNPDAPEGAQVAFLQGGAGSTISQTISGWAAGTYRLTFEAAQRGNYQMGGYQDFRILVNGQEVSRVRPVGTAYQLYTTPGFAVTAGAHTIIFQGVDTAGGDNTALLDQVSVEYVTPGQPLDAGFERPYAGPTGAYGSFLYRPTGSAWTYTGGAGVTADGSGFTSGNPDAPESAQVAFLQGGAGSTISQQVAGWADGSYALDFKAAQRGNHQTGGIPGLRRPDRRDRRRDLPAG